MSSSTCGIGAPACRSRSTFMRPRASYGVAAPEPTCWAVLCRGNGRRFGCACAAVIREAPRVLGNATRTRIYVTFIPSGIVFVTTKKLTTAEGLTTASC